MIVIKRSRAATRAGEVDLSFLRSSLVLSIAEDISMFLTFMLTLIEIITWVSRNEKNKRGFDLRGSKELSDP